MRLAPLLLLLAGCATTTVTSPPVPGVSWRVVEHDGVRLETWSTQDPRTGLTPVVLVPGMMGTARAALGWAGLVESLSRTRQVISLSLRGRGGSSTPLAGWTPEDHQADLAAVLKAWGVGAAHLVAHSMGVGYALGFAQAHPGQVLSVVSGDSAPWLGQVSQEWADGVARRASGAYDPQTPRRILAEQGAATATVALTGEEPIPLARDYRPLLASTTMPVLVLQRTEGFTPEALQTWLGIWSGARTAQVRVIAGGHDVFSSAEGSAEVLAFLKALP
jgi:pimeloyl-ACP methyl ester carboxylesterase